MLAGAATVAAALLAVDVIGALTGGESVDRTTYIVALGVLAPAGALAAVRLLRWGGTAGDAGRGWAVLAGLGTFAAVTARRLAGNAEPTEAVAIAVTLLCLVAVLLITQIDLGSAVLASPITPGLAVPALEQVGDAFRLEQVRIRRSGLVTSRLVPARAGPRFSCPPLP